MHISCVHMPCTPDLSRAAQPLPSCTRWLVLTRVLTACTAFRLTSVSVCVDRVPVFRYRLLRAVQRRNAKRTVSLSICCTLSGLGALFWQFRTEGALIWVILFWCAYAGKLKRRCLSFLLPTSLARPGSPAFLPARPPYLGARLGSSVCAFSLGIALRFCLRTCSGNV